MAAHKLTQIQKDEWLKALRSGDYEQGRNQLCNDGKYCCLGVLAELNPDIFEKTVSQNNKDYSYNGSASNLISKNGWELLSYADQNKFTRLNDISKLDFNQIANIIEEEILV